MSSASVVGVDVGAPGGKVTDDEPDSEAQPQEGEEAKQGVEGDALETTSHGRQMSLSK